MHINTSVFFMELRIKMLRKLKNMSQEALAAKTGLSLRMIIAYEKPEADIPIRKLQQIAHALEVPIFHLFTSEVEPADVNREVNEPRPELLGNAMMIDLQQKMITMLEEKVQQLERSLAEATSGNQRTG